MEEQKKEVNASQQQGLIQNFQEYRQKAETKEKQEAIIEKQQFYHMQDDLFRKQQYTDFQLVVPHLYIGSQISSLNLQKLLQLNIKHVLRVNGINQNIIAYDKHGIRFQVLDIDDMPDYKIDDHFEEAHQFMHPAIESQESVLVVCTAGISRSAAIVISYLIKHRKMPYEKAFKTVKNARVFIQPNVGFERVLRDYGKKHGCDLCHMEKKTEWFTQYGLKRYGQQLFSVLICDSCECPMVVYKASHKQELSTEELYEAFNLCEDVGNDYFGQGRWFIEGKQRQISDHFHWHVREMKVVNDIIAIRMLGKDPQIGQVNTRIIHNCDDDSIKCIAMEEIVKVMGSDQFHIKEKRIQRGAAQRPSNPDYRFRIDTRMRFKYEGEWAIEQFAYLITSDSQLQKPLATASMIPNIYAYVYYRLSTNTKKGQKDFDKILYKL